MNPFFFIPASKLNKLQKIEELGIDNIIIDFEDSIIIENKDEHKEAVFEINNFEKYWYRIPLRNSFDEILNSKFMTELLDRGVKKFVLPKLLNKDELDKLINEIYFNDLKFILLIEHPRFFLELESILKNREYCHIIYGLALGSHDFINELNAKHSLDILYYPRQKIKFIASAFDKIAIDIASMNISNKDFFKDETSNGRNLGFDAKFIIHPIQYQWLNESIQESSDFLWAKKIIRQLPKGELSSNHSPFILEGQIIEKPHIQRALNILEKYKNDGK